MIKVTEATIPHEGFDEAVVKSFYGFIRELSGSELFTFDPYDYDETIGLITLAALVGGGRRQERIGRSDGLTSRLEGKDEGEAAAISNANGHYINEAMAKGLLRSAARVIVKTFRDGTFEDPEAKKVRTVSDEEIKVLRAHHESLRQAALERQGKVPIAEEGN